ncbi:MAG: hypothetical protein LH473_03015, partial [Chitinophagales bacterium]|nr:hypothetical protein [Chitinophagales bacterium]
MRNPIDEKQESIFASGTDVGLLARNLFPGGEDASPPDPYSFHLSVAKTKKLIESGVKIIYEAAFESDGLLCAIDILVNSCEAWHAYEVKASTQVKPQFVTDTAFQYYVISLSGIPLADISVIHLNNEYVRNG